MADAEVPPTPSPLAPGDPGWLDLLDDPGSERIYDRHGERITLRQWGELRQMGERYVKIATDYLDDGNILVSTVWLGMDHNWHGGLPIIFETMTFVHMSAEQLEAKRAAWQAKGLAVDGFLWDSVDCVAIERYHTEEEARDGHRRHVDGLRMTFDALEQLLQADRI